MRLLWSATSGYSGEGFRGCLNGFDRGANGVIADFRKIRFGMAVLEHILFANNKYALYTLNC